MYRPLIRTSLAVLLALTPLTAAAQIDAAPAWQRCALRDDAPPKNAEAMQRLLARIKARYPKAGILKIVRGSQDLEGTILTYRVKLFPPDGRIVWLVLDATTLEPLDGASAGWGACRHS